MEGAAEKPSLDARLYKPTKDELEFWKSQTGIQDEDDLKKHIISVQTQAYEIFPYPCIRIFTFVKTLISEQRAYPQFLKLGRERSDAIFLEFGCCFGNDTRRAVADGFPSQNILATDLHDDFWKLGHKLFRSSNTTFPVPFIGGDIFDSKFVEPTPPTYSKDAITSPHPEFKSLTTLNPLHGRVSAILVSQFFHQFEEAQQTAAARAIASLLSPEPGSMIFGQHVTSKEHRITQRPIFNNVSLKRFNHSPETWEALWNGQVFEKGTVRVDARFKESQIAQLDPDVPVKMGCALEWAITRL